MKNIVIFKFDKIIIIHPFKKPETLHEACYGTFPKAQFINNALNEILKYRHNGDHIVLTAKGDERLVKESLLRLHACDLFDKIMIESEQPINRCQPAPDPFNTCLSSSSGIFSYELFPYGSILHLHE